MIRFTQPYYIEFEYVKEDENNQVEVLCNCNLCYNVRNIILFSTRRLLCKEHNI